MDPAKLARLLAPETIAVVGASEKLGMSNNAVLPMLDAGIDVRLVNPNRDSVYGRPTAPSLSALDEPIDAVLSLVSAERSIGVVAEAAAAGCGGVVVAAGGFGELGEEGKALQARLVDAASDGLAIVGPNCSGFMNVGRRVNLFTGGRITLEPGPVAVVSQSGFLLRSVLAAGQQRQLGFGVAVSSGNEAVCGLHDYIDLLAGDPDTRVICLVVEKVWSSDAFFAAVHRARSAGKALIVLKLGRTERSRKIMQSHTGAIADESWVYDIVLGQAGVLTANDIDDMLDHAQLLAQLPTESWRPIDGVAVMASSGGVAGVAADAADTSGVALPALEGLEPWVRERVPGDGSVNPLDMTGFVMRDPELMQELFTGYAAADGVGALVLCWWAGEGDEAWSRTLLEPLANAASSVSVPLIVTPVEGTAIGAWTLRFPRPRSHLLSRARVHVSRAARRRRGGARRAAVAPSSRRDRKPERRPPSSRRTRARSCRSALRWNCSSRRDYRSCRTSCSKRVTTTRRRRGNSAIAWSSSSPTHRTAPSSTRSASTWPTTTLLPSCSSCARSRAPTTCPRPSSCSRSSVVRAKPSSGCRRAPISARLCCSAVAACSSSSHRGWVAAGCRSRPEPPKDWWPRSPARARSKGCGARSPGPPRRSSPRWRRSRRCGNTPARGSRSVDLNPVIVTDDGVAVVDCLLVAAPPDGR